MVSKLNILFEVFWFNCHSWLLISKANSICTFKYSPGRFMSLSSIAKHTFFLESPLYMTHNWGLHYRRLNFSVKCLLNKPSIRVNSKMAIALESTPPRSNPREWSGLFHCTVMKLDWGEQNLKYAFWAMWKCYSDCWHSVREAQMWQCVRAMLWNCK